MGIRGVKRKYVGMRSPEYPRIYFGDVLYTSIIIEYRYGLVGYKFLCQRRHSCEGSFVYQKISSVGDVKRLLGPHICKKCGQIIVVLPNKGEGKW